MLSSKKIVEEYIDKSDWRVYENSNSPYSFGGLQKHITAEVSKDYWLRSVYPEKITKAYLNGKMHIHDLGGLTLYCCGFSLRNIINMGVKGVPNIPTSKSAKHFDALLNQIANLVTVYQNEIMGAVAFSSVDTLLAPYIKQDRLSYKEVKQHMQNFIFSINSNSRGGAEPAFSNITLDLTPPDDLLNENVLWGGKILDYTYKSCQTEMDMINKAFYELMIEGDANNKPFAYPIPTYNIHKRFDWDNPSNDMLWEISGRFGYPYFANFINSEMKPEDARSMCPMTSDTKVLVKSKQNGIRISTIADIYNNSNLKATQYEVWTNEGWKEGNPIQIPNTKVYKITLSNGVEVKFGENHLQPIMNGTTLKTSELQEGMWLPFNKKQFGTNLGNKELGFAVGAYLGDGSRDKNSIIYSLCSFEKDNITEQRLVNFWNSIGFDTKVIFDEKNVRFVRVNGNPIDIIEKYIEGEDALTKKLTRYAFNASIEFKEGIIEGFSATDGSRDKKRLYTSSNDLRHDIGSLFASIGHKYIINYEDNREGRLGTNVNYRIDYPERTNYGELYREDEQYHYYKIVKIEEYNYIGKYLYCFEVNSNDQLFMLANGLITHNCRLRLDKRELLRRNGGLFGSGDSTGSIGVVTINLPRIAYLNKGNKTRFFKDLERTLDLAKNSLEIKREWLQKNILDKNLIPAYSTYVGTLDNHFSTIGDVGKNEMCENFFDKDILSEEGKAFSIEVSNFIREKLKQYQEETGNLYNYEATPAESTCYRLAKKDREEFDDIITMGTEDAPYYTNSCHIPVAKVESIKQIFDHQNDLQILYTGGTVIHIFVGAAITKEQAKHIIKTVCENYEVPYVSISPLNRYCPNHGYIPEAVDKCPICGEEVEMYQRITGYLRKVKFFNTGKKSEFKDRKQLFI